MERLVQKLEQCIKVKEREDQEEEDLVWNFLKQQVVKHLQKI